MTSKTTRSTKTVPRPYSGPSFQDVATADFKKSDRIESAAIRASARGEDCTFQIVGVCNQQTDTTVLCHLPDESHGMSRKADDLSSAYGCSACHDVIDGRVKHDWQPGEKDFYMRRAQSRTWRRLREKGIFTIKGAA